MSLEEEIALYQFGQGVRSADDLLSRFIHLSENQQRSQFINLYCQVSDSALVDSDIEQALADCSLEASDAMYAYLNLDHFKTGSKRVVYIPHTENPPDGKLEKAYEVILYLFKAAYQRRYALEKENPTKWWYWDLSNDEVAQGILTRHQALVDEVYNTPSFRSEFTSLAKLWYENKLRDQTRFKEPASERQTHFGFLTYDEMVTESVDHDKHERAIWLLGRALEKAFSRRYQLDTDQARRLTFDVIERHLRETYQTGLFE